MFSASVFTCIITMVFNFTIVFIISVFMFKPFFANMTVNLIKIWFVLLVCLWYPFLFFNVSYLQCVLPYGFAKLLMQFSPLYTSCFFLCYLYTSCLFSMSSNVHIVDIECLQGICSHTFVVHDFSGLFSDPSTFLIKGSRSA